MSLNKLEIKTMPDRTKRVYLNGEELQSVARISQHFTVDDLPRVEIEFIQTEVIYDNDVYQVVFEGQ
jgi:hypothetical protein